MDELYQNLVRLSPKEQVPFRCIGCGACCKHVHMQVPVETLDAFRIVKHGSSRAKISSAWMILGTVHRAGAVKRVRFFRVFSQNTGAGGSLHLSAG